MTALSHLCVIDQAWGQDSWTLAKFFFAVLWTEAKSGSMRRPMSSHLDRTSWLMKDWLYGQKENFYAGPTREILAWDQVHSGGKTKKKSTRDGSGEDVWGGKRAVSSSPVHRWTRFARRCFTPFLPFSPPGKSRTDNIGPCCPPR